MEVGIAWVNDWFLRDLRTPFGGVKLSGIGREGGAHSLAFFSEAHEHLREAVSGARKDVAAGVPAASAVIPGMATAARRVPAFSSRRGFHFRIRYELAARGRFDRRSGT